MSRFFKYVEIGKQISSYLIDHLLDATLGYLYNSGSALGLIMSMQVSSGIMLACYYVASIVMAFKQLRLITLNKPGAHLVRLVHINGASLMFLTLYTHIGRALWMGSGLGKRKWTWFIGIIIFLLLILTAFLGYSLVYGQMSYWAICVISNLLTIIPIVGKALLEWIYGDVNISTTTLTRFYSLHYILPLIVIIGIIGHLIALHRRGSTNPLGVETQSIKINFHPYYTWKDLVGLIGLSLVWVSTLWLPYWSVHADNFVEANPLVTPVHIQPEFYFLFYYMALRSIPDKTLGVLGLLSIFVVMVMWPYTHKGFTTTVNKWRPLMKPI